MHLGLRMCSQGTQAYSYHLCSFLWSCYSLTVPITEELIHLSGVPLFATATQKTPIYHLALIVSGSYAYGIIRLHTLHALKTAALEPGFSSLASNKSESRC